MQHPTRSSIGHAGNQVEIAGKYGHNLTIVAAIPHVHPDL
jgi:hypothetical protein